MEAASREGVEFGLLDEHEVGVANRGVYGGDNGVSVALLSTIVDEDVDEEIWLRLLTRSRDCGGADKGLWWREGGSGNLGFGARVLGI